MTIAAILKKLEEHDSHFARIDARFAEQNERFGRLDGRLDRQDQRLDKQDQRLDRQEQRSDRMEATLNRLEERTTRIEKELVSLRDLPARVAIFQEHNDHRFDIVCESIEHLHAKLDRVIPMIEVLQNHEVRITSGEKSFEKSVRKLNRDRT